MRPCPPAGAIPTPFSVPGHSSQQAGVLCGVWGFASAPGTSQGLNPTRALASTLQW